ncbi:MAG: hypothetical protein ACYCPW_04080 [Nitrososphaerales archaeon]
MDNGGRISFWLIAEIFSEDYIQKLLRGHDVAICTAKSYAKLVGKKTLTDTAVQRAVRLTRSILPHVSDCEGLTIIVQKLPDKIVQSILDATQHARTDNLDLLRWASEVRNRPPVLPD